MSSTSCVTIPKAQSFEAGIQGSDCSRKNLERIRFFQGLRMNFLGQEEVTLCQFFWKIYSIPF